MRMLLTLPVLLALAGCGQKEAKSDKTASFGQVLPGSASDAMLPYDTATSAPPLESPGAALSGGSDAGSGTAPDAMATGADDADADSAPEPEAS